MASTLSSGEIPDRRMTRGHRGPSCPPVTVAAPAESELIVHGLAGLLAPFSSRVRLIDRDPVSGPPVDVVLFDCLPEHEPAEPLTGRLPEPMAGVIVAYSWHTQPGLVRWAMERGFAGYLSKALPGDELVEALEAVRAGETVVRLEPRSRDRCPPTFRVARGEQRGLTPREAEALMLVCSGLSNVEIAHRMNISLNSLKTYIRSAYRRIDVTTRSQAVVWGIDHGFGTPG
jgi:NarL family two-component system response regulator LiaR